MFEVMNHKREASECEQIWQNGFPQQRKRTSKKDEEGRGQMIIVDQNHTERCGHPFAAAEQELNRPYVTRDDREHCYNDDAVIRREIACSPYCEHPFEKVPDQRDHKPRPAHYSADVLGSYAAAADFADVLAGAHLDQVVTSRKTTEQIRAKPNPACLGPVSRVQLFHPRHFINQLISNFRYFGLNLRKFRPNCALKILTLPLTGSMVAIQPSGAFLDRVKQANELTARTIFSVELMNFQCWINRFLDKWMNGIRAATRARCFTEHGCLDWPPVIQLDEILL